MTFKALHFLLKPHQGFKLKTIYVMSVFVIY